MSSRPSALALLLVLLLLPVSGCGHRATPPRLTLPRSTTVVDVTWSAPLYAEGGQAPGVGGHRHLTGSAVTTIVDWLNGLPATRSADHCDACPYPLFYGTQPIFTFHLAAGTAVFSCTDEYQVDVTIDGRPQRELAASADFLRASESFMHAALHVTQASRS